MDNEILLPAQSIPGAYAVLNPFVIVDDAAGLITLVSEVSASPRRPRPELQCQTAS